MPTKNLGRRQHRNLL